MLRVQLGVSTVEREAMLMNGSDWEDNATQIIKEKKVFEDAGLTYLAFQGMPNVVREKIGSGEATAGTQVTPAEGEPGTKGEDTEEQPETGAPSPTKSQNK